MDEEPGFVDESGDVVLKFVSAARNLSRLGELTDEVVSIAKSGAWRKYRTAVGKDQWLECELDYFLIACDLQYDDISRVLSYTRDSADIAEMMNRDADASRRRTLEDAASAWNATIPETLVQRAQRLGWTRNEKTNSLRAAPVPPRARSRQTHGMSKDEQAKRNRTERLAPSRLEALDREVARIRAILKDDTERRYVVDRLRERELRPGRARLGKLVDFYSKQFQINRVMGLMATELRLRLNHLRLAMNVRCLAPQVR